MHFPLNALFFLTFLTFLKIKDYDEPFFSYDIEKTFIIFGNVKNA